MDGGPEAANGELLAVVATQAHDVLIAAHQLGERVGVARLAHLTGLNPNTLQHKLNLSCLTHHLNLAEAVVIQSASEDHRILQAMARTLGHVCIYVGPAPSGTTFDRVMELGREFGDLLAAVQEARADHRITENDIQRCERELSDLFRAGNALVASLRAEIPAGGAA